MSKSLAKILIHLIYSTKSHKPDLAEALRPKLFAYQAGIFQKLDCPAIVIGGAADHIHALFMLSKNRGLADVVEEVKKTSSRWIKDEACASKSFYCQTGYGAFSVSQSSVNDVVKYIQDQDHHHRTMTFQDEFLLLLKRYGLQYDERYIWG